MEVEEGTLKLDLKNLTLIGGTVALSIIIFAPHVITQVFFSNNFAVVSITILCALSGHISHFFDVLFKVNGPESRPLHEENPDNSENIQKFHFFDGKMRVVVLLKKEHIVRKTTVLQIANEPEPRDRQAEYGTRRRQTRNDVLDEFDEPVYVINNRGEIEMQNRNTGGGGRGRRGRSRSRGSERVTNQSTQDGFHDMHLHLCLQVSQLEADKSHWSYFLSYFGYESQKVEKIKYNQQVTL